MLNVSRGSVKQFKNNVDDFRLASPWLDNGWLDSIYASVIVTVLGCGVEDSLDNKSQPATRYPREDGAPEQYRWLPTGRQAG